MHHPDLLLQYSYETFWNIRLKQLKHLKLRLTICMKTLKNTALPTATTYFVWNCGSASLPFLPTTQDGWGQERRHRPPQAQAQAQASTSSASATGEVDGAQSSKGRDWVPHWKEQRGKRRPRKRDAGAGASWWGASGEERAPCRGTLRRQGRPEVRCGERLWCSWGHHIRVGNFYFFFFRLVRWEAGLGAASDGTDRCGWAFPLFL
jgi:hypothetical protein